eukprot:TRINITY_DN1316_c0_g1_i2.p1 TRINITY_DN1316_c0_g1~~TRINITY_DN1316_c0_g1_i2.p1  ORF type:complete len:327 (+),score=58.67 TRINITY_DN1316_c0_g1_i2:103-981(+)
MAQTATIFGHTFHCNKDARVRVGPVIGKVTHNSAIILVEVSLSVDITIHLIPKDRSLNAHQHHNQHHHDEHHRVSGRTKKNRPKGFLVQGLAPSTTYHVIIEGVNAKDAANRTGTVRTISHKAGHLKIVTLSCDRPERLRDGDVNMWACLATEVAAGNVDVVLHLGDQVYGQKEFQDAQAVLRYSGLSRTSDASGASNVHDKNIRRLHKQIKDRMRDIYRFTWNLPGTATVLSHTSNLMIWSDNDIYNDFTIAKEEGQTGLEPIMIHLAHQVYRAGLFPSSRRTLAPAVCLP